MATDLIDTLEKKLDKLVQHLKIKDNLNEHDGHGNTPLFYGKILH